MSVDVPRNIFIAVGSSAIVGMIHLLDRLKEDGVYDQKRDDIFIGMDSDVNRLQDLKNFDLDSNPIRIHTVQLTLSSSSPEKNIVTCFEPDWKNMGGITASGVGGDRRLSFTTLNWTGFWDDIGLDKLLTKGDRVILLGTAFGGTSTGIFWNIAEFIQMRVASKIESLPERTKGLIQFFGMLLLPEKNSQNSDIYPLYRNLCAFLQDMQVIEWRQILEQQMSVNRSFISPVYSAWDKKTNKLPVFVSDKYRCAEASNLPMEMLFVLPTPENSQGQTKLYFTELAFTLFYMNLSSKIVSTTIDSYKQKIDPEEICFGGFNMIVARSASNAVLKARYYDLLSQHWNVFWKGDLPDSDEMVDEVCSIINKIATKNDESSNLVVATQKIVDEISSSNVSTLSKEFPEHLQEFAVTSCDTVPYVWLSLESLIKEVYSGFAKESTTSMPLAAIAKAYKREYESMTARAENAGNLLENIASQLRKAVKLQKERGNSKIAKLVNGTEGAKAEVTAKIKEYLVSAVEEFVDAHRAAATIKSMPAPMDIETLRSLPKYAKTAVQIENLIKVSMTPQKSKLKGFVFEDINNDLHLDVSAPGLNFTKICLEFVLAEDESALMAVIKKYESQGIDILRGQANDLNENNPLKKLHTRIPANELNSYCADVFRIEHPGKGHLHFCYTCGQPSNIDWPTWTELKNVLGFASFGRFPGAGAENATAVLDSSLQGPGDNSWFFDNHVSGFFKNIQGVWLGTLDLNKKVGEILQSSFRGAPIDDWEKNAWEAEDIHGAARLRLMSLRDMVYMGLVLGAIEKKVIDVTHLDDNSFNRVKVNLKVKTKAGETIIACNNASPSDLGFNIKLKINEVRLEWIEKLMRWFADKDTGFVRDFELSRDSIDGHLLFEKQCINKIKLQVPAEWLKEIEMLFDRIYDFIEVTPA